jgi:hypothetical protein
VASQLAPLTPLSAPSTPTPRLVHRLAALLYHVHSNSPPPLPDQVFLPDQAFHNYRVLIPGVSEGPYQPPLPEAARSPGLVMRIKQAVRAGAGGRVTSVSAPPVSLTGAVRSPSEARSL